jgi:hypothetical protein
VQAGEGGGRDGRTRRAGGSAGTTTRRRWGFPGAPDRPSPCAAMADVGASATAIRAVGRVGTAGSGGVTARQLVQILDLMGVISNESHAAGLMAEIGYTQKNGAATVYPARSLDQLAEHLSKGGPKVSLPGRAAYRASAGPAAAMASESNDYRRGGMPQAQAGLSVAARLKAEIDKRKSPQYLQERARLAVRWHPLALAHSLS